MANSLRAIKAARRQIDGSHDGADMVSKKHLGVELEMLQLVDLDANIFHNAQSADRLYQLSFLSL